MAVLEEAGAVAAAAWDGTGSAGAARCIWCGEVITRWETYLDGTPAPNLWAHVITGRLMCSELDFSRPPFATPPPEYLR